MQEINTDSIIANVKLDLGIDDTLQDNLLSMLLKRVTDHFKAEYGERLFLCLGRLPNCSI